MAVLLQTNCVLDPESGKYCSVSNRILKILVCFQKSNRLQLREFVHACSICSILYCVCGGTNLEICLICEA